MTTEANQVMEISAATRRLSVLMVATSYPANLGDWRGLFIRHLSDALGRRSDLRVSMWAPPGEHTAAVTDATTPDESRWLGDLMQSGGIAHALRSNRLRGGWQALNLLLHLRRAYKRHTGQFDLLHCNWLQTMLPAPRKLPVLVTVLGTDMQLLKLPLMPALLRWAMHARPVAICPNAEWMEAPLRTLFGKVARVQTVPFGIDVAWFDLQRRVDFTATSRWLVVSRLTRDKLGSLLEWGGSLFKDQLRELHLFGPMQEQIDLPPWVHYHGPATPAQLCATWFPQAHGLITLSRHSEGRPQVMLEAMAAGLPIIASRLPAHADLISHDRTGLLCDSPTDFHACIERLESLDQNQRIGAAARAWVRASIGTWDDCAARYDTLYRKLVAGSAR
ncbi:MAG: glycosyltransferase family 4 protein [Metallibacterium scheffleri]|uniref:glycosyltransferase family 4 protein n=1 Tax=Metallibacterium scheffleri TaxID=993689 RepID=UPI0026EE9EBF|nr:glycosyltransferase family 4 protein [Metallibacterium scheffleri]MCK9365954.1 glycosyltransferase family 4 protein [Metallibacterium scheffleri]